MNEDEIIVIIAFGDIHDTIAYRILPVFSTANDGIKFCNTELVAISTKCLLPAVNADNNNFIDLWMTLEGFQRIDDDGLVIYIEKLFGDVLMHALAGTASDDKCDIHVVVLQYSFKY